MTTTPRIPTVYTITIKIIEQNIWEGEFYLFVQFDNTQNYCLS